jgi:hypothetical protein
MADIPVKLPCFPIGIMALNYASATGILGKLFGWLTACALFINKALPTNRSIGFEKRNSPCYKL